VSVQDLPALHTLVVNSLEEQIAVIDEAGAILDVNLAWTQFGAENGLPSRDGWAGRNYLEVLRTSFAAGDSLAGEAARGIQEVVEGERASFYLEYPCHSPQEKRWFIMRVTRLKDDARRLFVISHQNITARKLAEERAEHLAMHDALTELANRRYFNLFLSNEMRRSIRNRSPISLLEIDVDYFKDYNDALGHLAGDRCLAGIGRALRVFARRPGDLAARLGGDEFALVLGGADVAEAQKIAEAILAAVDKLDMVFAKSRRVTVSVGLACVVPDERHDEHFLLQEADKALYRAKASGRNRVVQVQLAGVAKT